MTYPTNFFDEQIELIRGARKILVVQAENPDGDSIGSALALEEILGNLPRTEEDFAKKSRGENFSRKNVALHCPVQIPTYLRFISGWDRVSLDFPTDADLAIIVDTSSKTLMSKTLRSSVAMNFFSKTPTIVLDHHILAMPDLPFHAEYLVSDTAVSTGEFIYDLFSVNFARFGAKKLSELITPQAAEDIYISIQADSLGLTTEATTAESFFATGKLVELGAVPARIEEKRRELMKKKPEILDYKAKLIERIEYLNDGRTAVVKVPFDEIQKYSNDYNPTMLVLDEMRLVVGVDVAIGLKTYPDGKITGKIRSNIGVADRVAKLFGGDGHAFAAGFRIYENYADFVAEFSRNMEKIYSEWDAENSRTFGSEMARENYENVAGKSGDSRQIRENHPEEKAFRVRKLH